MNRRIKQLWIDDLRANPDKQGQGGLLSTSGKACCLGRLCLLAEQAGVIKRRKQGNDLWVSFGYNGDTGYLPTEVQKWAGVDSTGGYNENKNYLAEDNDNGKTFPEIADIIEEYF